MRESPEEVAQLRSRLELLKFKKQAALVDGYHFGAMVVEKQIAHIETRLRLYETLNSSAEV